MSEQDRWQGYEVHVRPGSALWAAPAWMEALCRQILSRPRRWGREVEAFRFDREALCAGLRQPADGEEQTHDE